MQMVSALAFVAIVAKYGRTFLLQRRTRHAPISARSSRTISLTRHDKCCIVTLAPELLHRLLATVRGISQPDGAERCRLADRLTDGEVGLGASFGTN